MNRIDEMMRDYRLDEDASMKFEPLTKEEELRILEKTLIQCGLGDEAEGSLARGSERIEISDTDRSSHASPKRSFPRKRLFTLLLAGMLLLGTVAASAAFQLDEKLLSLFHFKDQKQQEEIGESGLLIGKSVEDNGTTVEVKESIGSDNSIYILFDLTAPEGTVLNEESCYFGKASFNFVELFGGSYGMGYSVNSLQNGEKHDNKLSFVLQADSSKEFVGKTVELTLEDLKNYDSTIVDPELAEKVVLHGQWKVRFKLDYRDVSKNYAVSQEIPIFGGVAQVTKISISPLSVSIDLEGDCIAKYDENPPKIGDNETSGPFRVHMKDGTVVEASGGGNHISGREMNLQNTFYEILDVGEIRSVELFGVEVPLN